MLVHQEVQLQIVQQVVEGGGGLGVDAGSDQVGQLVRVLHWSGNSDSA